MIRMLRTAAGPFGTWIKGQLVTDVTEELAESLVGAGAAAWTTPRPAVVEVATMPAVENAAMRTTKPRKNPPKVKP